MLARIMRLAERFCGAILRGFRRNRIAWSALIAVSAVAAVPVVLHRCHANARLLEVENSPCGAYRVEIYALPLQAGTPSGGEFSRLVVLRNRHGEMLASGYGVVQGLRWREDRLEVEGVATWRLPPVSLSIQDGMKEADRWDWSNKSAGFIWLQFWNLLSGLLKPAALIVIWGSGCFRRRFLWTLFALAEFSSACGVMTEQNLYHYEDWGYRLPFGALAVLAAWGRRKWHSVAGECVCPGGARPDQL